MWFPLPWLSPHTTDKRCQYWRPGIQSSSLHPLQKQSCPFSILSLAIDINNFCVKQSHKCESLIWSGNRCILCELFLTQDRYLQPYIPQSLHTPVMKNSIHTLKFWETIRKLIQKKKINYRKCFVEASASKATFYVTLFHQIWKFCCIEVYMIICFQFYFESLQWAVTIVCFPEKKV